LSYEFSSIGRTLHYICRDRCSLTGLLILIHDLFFCNLYKTYIYSTPYINTRLYLYSLFSIQKNIPIKKTIIYTHINTGVYINTNHYCFCNFYVEIYLYLSIIIPFRKREQQLQRCANSKDILKRKIYTKSEKGYLIQIFRKSII
jgi:hypothetical protein